MYLVSLIGVLDFIKPVYTNKVWLSLTFFVTSFRSQEAPVIHLAARGETLPTKSESWFKSSLAVPKDTLSHPLLNSHVFFALLFSRAAASSFHPFPSCLFFPLWASFLLEWFVYPQSPWVISAVIITGVGNKHTPFAERCTQTDTQKHLQYPGMRNNLSLVS